MSDSYLISPQLYDDQFWWKKDDLEFWKSLLIHNNKTILEFAAGTGRIACPLLREGGLYSGVELSRKYVKYANNKIDDCSPIVQGDMRNINLNQKFDYLFIGFNSFLHLLTNSDALLFLDNVKHHMHVGSYFYIDIFVPHPLFLYKPSNVKFQTIDFFDTRRQEEAEIYETVSYNKDTEIASIIWEYASKSQGAYQNFPFKMKMYYPNTIKKLLFDSGLYITNIWGGYDFSLLDTYSSLQIYECTLRNSA